MTSRSMRIGGVRERLQELAQQTEGEASSTIAEASRLLADLEQKLVEWQKEENVTAIEQARQRAELEAGRAQRLAEEQNKVFEAIADGVLVFDANGDIYRANQATVQGYGFDPVAVSREESLNLLDVRHPDGTPLSLEEQPSVRSLHGEMIHGERLIQTNAQGRQQTILTSAAPLYDAQENISGSVVVWHDITDLEQDHARLQAIIENAPQGIVVTDPQARILMINRVAEEIYTRPIPFGQEYPAHASLQLCDSDGAPYDPRNLPLTRSALDGETFHNVQLQIIWPDGQRRDLLANTAPILSAEGIRTGAVGIFLDITALKREERNHEFLANLGQIMMLKLEPEEVLRLVTTRLRQYIGCSRCVVGEYLQETREAAFQEDRADNLIPLPERTGFNDLPPALASFITNDSTDLNMVVPDCLADDRTGDMDFLLFFQVCSFISIPRPRVDGTAALIVTESKPRQWRSDEVDVISSTADITWLALDRARLFKDLADAQKRLNLALRNSSTILFTMDRSLRYTWIYNPERLSLIETMIGKRDDEILTPEDAQELIAYKQEVMDTGQSLQQEVRYTVGGRMGVYDLRIDPLLNQEGQVVGLSGIAIEITERKNLEQEMVRKAAQVELQRAILQHRELERVEIARDLHDGILQELVGIGFELNEIVELEEDPERKKRLYKLQATAAEQVRELRAFCSELRPPALAPFGVEKALRSHIESFQKKYPNLEIELDLARDGRFLSEVMRLTVFRICQELLNNIAKHSGASKASVHFAFDIENVELVVSDNGHGFILPDRWIYLAREGHLGLVGIQERTEAVGGQLSVETGPGKGTRVTILIPLRGNQSAEGDVRT